VLVIEPDNGYASNSLAYAMLKEGGNLDLAFSMAQNARRKLPDRPETADTLGFAFYQRRVYTSAIGLFQEAVRGEPANVLYNCHLGMAYARNGQAALARQQLDRVQRIKPNASETDDLRRALAEGRG
jgi:Flp pilus assembly protein TadD